MMRSVFLLAAIAIHLATLASTATAGDVPVTLKVRLDRDSYIPGEPILMLLEFENHSNKTYEREHRDENGQVFDLHEGTEYDLQAVLKGPGGYVQSWRPRFRRRRNALGYGAPTLPFRPHKRTQCTIILSRVFRPTAPGEYQLNWTLEVPVKDFDYPLDRPSKGLRVEAEGIAKIRVGAANREALEKRADALLADAQVDKGWFVPSLSFLATMPPDIAVRRFRRFFNLKNTKKPNGQFEGAMHSLVYVDTKEAVDLIAEVNKWTFQFNKINHNAPPQTFQDVGFGIHCESIHALENMYYTTDKPEIRRHILNAMRRLAPELLNDP